MYVNSGHFNFKIRTHKGMRTLQNSDNAQIGGGKQEKMGLRLKCYLFPYKRGRVTFFRVANSIKETALPTGMRKWQLGGEARKDTQEQLGRRQCFSHYQREE